MDIRSARLMIPHPTAQHSQPPIPLLSPNTKSIYNLEYLHQVGSQISDHYRSQQNNDFYSSNVNSTTNGSRVSYSNERNNGCRYSNSNANSGNKYSNTAQVNNTSVSPPLSNTSSGSSTTSSKNSRTSKPFNGNSMHTINTHRNIPTTPTLPQSHSGYFQSQSIPLFHSAASNGMQQMFSNAISPSSQSQHSNQSVGLYVKQNSTPAYHPNNNYHSHNRNYSSNGGNKKIWNFYRYFRKSQFNLEISLESCLKKHYFCFPSRI